jgi:N-acetylglucosaminyl-diphospho-decaprenol L-rhamnosyltransferase
VSEPGVSLVVVHYRGADELARCLASAFQIPAIVEAIVVDNEGVADALRREHPDPRVRVLAMARNAGYGGAANAGLQTARHPTVLVMNQDATIGQTALSSMLQAGAAGGAWVVGPRLVDASGSLTPVKGLFPRPLRWSEDGRGPGWRTVPWVSGAAMLFMPARPDDLRFDDRLFMYVEDEELCWRVWRDGGRVVLAERALVEHAGGTASATRWSLGAITRRTVLNRARMVRWHAGIRGLAPFSVGVVKRRLNRLRSR